MAFNTAVFAHPVNQYGNSGRGILTAMPYDNIDFSLMKAIPVWESFDFQFRAEFFNVFNIQNYGLPGNYIWRDWFRRDQLTGCRAPLQGRYSSA